MFRCKMCLDDKSFQQPNDGIYNLRCLVSYLTTCIQRHSPSHMRVMLIDRNLQGKTLVTSLLIADLRVRSESLSGEFN
jgi:hypothetical protein